MAIYREKDFTERRNAAVEAKKALLERFKSRPSEDDPTVVARKEAEEQARLEAAAREAEELESLARHLADEAEQKARRDARYAARKSRVGTRRTA